jgi:hypothetical protein
VDDSEEIHVFKHEERQPTVNNPTNKKHLEELEVDAPDKFG